MRSSSGLTQKTYLPSLLLVLMSWSPSCIGRRRIWITGVTAHPNGGWVTQQARNVTSDLADEAITTKFLVGDRDTKYVASFDNAFRAEGAEILQTPHRPRTRTPSRSGWCGP